MNEKKTTKQNRKNRRNYNKMTLENLSALKKQLCNRCLAQLLTLLVCVGIVTLLLLFSAHPYIAFAICLAGCTMILLVSDHQTKKWDVLDHEMNAEKTYSKEVLSYTVEMLPDASYQYNILMGNSELVQVDAKIVHHSKAPYPITKTMAKIEEYIHPNDDGTPRYKNITILRN